MFPKQDRHQTMTDRSPRDSASPSQGGSTASSSAPASAPEAFAALAPAVFARLGLGAVAYTKPLAGSPPAEATAGVLIESHADSVEEAEAEATAAEGAESPAAPPAAAAESDADSTVQRIALTDQGGVAIHAADGTRVGWAPTMASAQALIRRNDMVPLTLH